jgi:hydrogenase maturation protease
MRYLIGIGNYTRGDDAVGLRVIEHVVAAGLERGFRAIDLGPGGVNLLFYLGPDTSAAVIVDSARMGLAPSDFRFFGPEDAESRKVLAGFSTHEGDLMQTLALARATIPRLPPIAFLGIEPEDVREFIGLSPKLQARIPDYAAAAIARLIAMTPNA